MKAQNRTAWHIRGRNTKHFVTRDQNIKMNQDTIKIGIGDPMKRVWRSDGPQAIEELQCRFQSGDWRDLWGAGCGYSCYIPAIVGRR